MSQENSTVIHSVLLLRIRAGVRSRSSPRRRRRIRHENAPHVSQSTAGPDSPRSLRCAAVCLSIRSVCLTVGWRGGDSGRLGRRRGRFGRSLVLGGKRRLRGERRVRSRLWRSGGRLGRCAGARRGGERSEAGHAVLRGVPTSPTSPAPPPPSAALALSLLKLFLVALLALAVVLVLRSCGRLGGLRRLRGRRVRLASVRGEPAPSSSATPFPPPRRRDGGHVVLPLPVCS